MLGLVGTALQKLKARDTETELNTGTLGESSVVFRSVAVSVFFHAIGFRGILLLSDWKEVATACLYRQLLFKWDCLFQLSF